LENDLAVLECQTCGGYWLKSFQYWLWKERLVEAGFDRPAGEACALKPADELGLKICPECFKPLQKYLVGRGASFHIDRCEVCRGIWFDHNEWEILRGMNLHDEIHFIFSSHWQSAARREGVEEHRATALRKLIGDAGFSQVSAFRTWLQSQEQRVSILGYLNQI
jgi:Zn-finger nucleic acid-binding protein